MVIKKVVIGCTLTIMLVRVLRLVLVLVLILTLRCTFQLEASAKRQPLVRDQRRSLSNGTGDSVNILGRRKGRS